MFNSYFGRIFYFLDIDKRTRCLDPDHCCELPDNTEESKNLLIDSSDIVEEESSMYIDFIYSFILIFHEVELCLNIFLNIFEILLHFSTSC